MDSEIESRFDRIDNTLTDLNKRLFKGNGKEPWDVRLDRLERWKKTTCWVYLTVASAAVYSIIKRIF